MTGAATPDPYQAFFGTTQDACCIAAFEPGTGGNAGRLRILQANQPFAALLDTGLAGPLAENFWLARLCEVAHGGPPLQVCMAAGPHRWAQLQAFALPGQAGQHLIGLRLQDRTQTRDRVEQLIGLRRIRTVGVLFWGTGFGLEDVNDGFVRMSGFSREEALGRTWQELTPPEFHTASWRAVQQVLTLGEAEPYEKQYFRRDGSRWWGLFAPRKVGDQVIEFVLDVSERRHAEAALREADRRKDEFLATLAHELRNPLAPIRNGVQILRLKAPADEAMQRTLGVVDRQMDHLVRLVDDLLDVARITSGKVRIERKPVALGDVLSRALEAVQPELDAKHQHLSVDMPTQVIRVLGDADRLTQVFSNLLSNAVKYTPQGGRIDVGASTSPAQLEVTVSDSGIGIAPDQQAGVFELFSQVRGHQPQAGGGLGIGLALVRDLVHQHGGCVSVHSAGADQGSRFTVRLPLLERTDCARQEPPQRTPAASPRRRVLVADDNADAADMLAGLLRAAGHEVATAADGLQAVRLAADFQPDVAFLDLGMPRLDGLEAARRIRASRELQGVRLVALTGWGQSTDRQRTAEVGFDLHLVKPLTPAGLQAALQLTRPASA